MKTVRSERVSKVRILPPPQKNRLVPVFAFKAEGFESPEFIFLARKMNEAVPRPCERDWPEQESRANLSASAGRFKNSIATDRGALATILSLRIRTSERIFVATKMRETVPRFTCLGQLLAFGEEYEMDCFSSQVGSQ